MAPSDDLSAELQRRESCADKLERFLKARPGVWLPMRELAAVGGLGGWRTRLSELGRRRADPLTIEHNGKNGAASCHRYLVQKPHGRSADVPVPDQWPAFEAPRYEEPWGLKP